jgi:hypothetical protein
MKQVLKIALMMGENILDSKFAIIDDGLYADRHTDYVAQKRFLDTVEALRDGFGDSMRVKLVQPSLKSKSLYVPATEWHEKKANDLNEILSKYASKIGVASPI